MNRDNHKLDASWLNKLVKSKDYMIFRSIALLTIIVFVGVAFFAMPTLSSCDEDVYSKIVPIGGIVTTTETESGKVSASQSKAIIFQRKDCKKCLFSVFTDAEGKYQAYVGEGTYQIIVADCGRDKNKDCLSPDHPRFINAKAKANPQFDIKLVHSKEDNAVTPPNGIEVNPK